MFKKALVPELFCTLYYPVSLRWTWIECKGKYLETYFRVGILWYSPCSLQQSFKIKQLKKRDVNMSVRHCVWVTQIYEDGVLLWGQLLQQLFVRSGIGGRAGRDRLPEQVLFGKKLPDLSPMLPRDACRRAQRDEGGWGEEVSSSGMVTSTRFQPLVCKSWGEWKYGDI